MTSMAIGISILNEGTVAALNEHYPLVMDRLQKEASFVINCTQAGFMLYYLYSRRLVTKLTVQSICKAYHIPMSLVFVFRVQYDLCCSLNGNATVDNNAVKHSLPWPMVVQPIILAIAMSGKLLPLLVKMGVVAGSKFVAAALNYGANVVSQSPVEGRDYSLERSLNERKLKQSLKTQYGQLITRPRRRSSGSIRVESAC